jgi:hypothetical protein
VLKELKELQVTQVLKEPQVTREPKVIQVLKAL